MTGLKTLMQDVAGMVSDQGVQLDQTETNVKTADTLVEEGVQEIEYVLPFSLSPQRSLFLFIYIISSIIRVSFLRCLVS